MGLKDKLRKYFQSKEDLPEESQGDHQIPSEEQQNFLALADEITSEIFAELNSEDDEVRQVEAMLVSEYDAGDVELTQLNDEELVNYNELNVVQHETYDDIEEYLTDAEIIGDMPEEVEF